MTFVILSGGIDLSVGSVIAFSGVFIAVMLRESGLHPVPRLRAPPRLDDPVRRRDGAHHPRPADAALHRDARRHVPGPRARLCAVGRFRPDRASRLRLGAVRLLADAGKGRLTLIGGLMLLVVLAGVLLAHRTRFGANVFALGGGVATARLMGVPIARTTVLIYALSGFLAGLSGIVFSFYTSAGYSLAAVGVELDAIRSSRHRRHPAHRGSGFVAGTLVGVLIMGLIQTLHHLRRHAVELVDKIVIGALLLAFIVLQMGLLQLASRRRPGSGAGA